MYVLREGTIVGTQLDGWVVRAHPDETQALLAMDGVARRAALRRCVLEHIAKALGVALAGPEPAAEPYPTCDDERALLDALAVMRWGPTD